MLLAQDKRLSLGDSIRKYLENLSAAELLSAAHKVPLRFTPGEKWEYSNTGYVALAEIIRVVAAKPWTEYLQQKIVGPAGMHVTLPTNTKAAVPNRAVGYGGRDNERKVDEWVALRASGAFLSNVLDLAKWDALPGFTSHFVRYVNDGLTVIALSNGDDSDMGSIANGVAALYLR
jgi:CubicO group peptidase (beta-lactamase class C family)